MAENFVFEVSTLSRQRSWQGCKIQLALLFVLSVEKLRQPFLTFFLFRILDILRRIRILGSVHWVHWVTDPALFGSGFQDAKKIIFLLISYCRYRYIHISLCSKIALRSRKTIEIMVFLNLLAFDRRSGFIQIITDPDQILVVLF